MPKHLLGYFWVLNFKPKSILLGEPPYLQISQVKAIYKIRTQGKPEIDTSKYSDVFLDFLDKCLEVDVKKRWTATQLLKVSIDQFFWFLANPIKIISLPLFLI